MMINKRLINIVPKSKKYIYLNVIYQWISLIANIILMGSMALFMQSLLYGEYIKFGFYIGVVVVTLSVRFLCNILATDMSFKASELVKTVLREKIYTKLLKLGSSYKQNVSTSEIVQVTVEGVDQLEIYFGSYLPQFFYSILAPITLFIVTSFINTKAAFILLICVPLIPISIAFVQTFAKKLLAKYWGQYANMGNSFLENLQGLTTLKIYQSDEFKNAQMNEEAEKFRKITMKVLSMQLNSITIMDLVAYGGAALGVIVAVNQFTLGNITLFGCLFIMLISADFFLPMRLLGSFFHVAMNGMSASDKIFRILDLEVDQGNQCEFPQKLDSITIKKLNFSYSEERNILSDINLEIKKGELTCIVGESGCGKSTLAGLLMGYNNKYLGEILINSTNLLEINEEELLQNIGYLGHNSYVFKGTVKENLLLAKPQASDKEMWEVLEQVNLLEFLKNENGLETQVQEKGSNLSGGQRQRLALARAILHSPQIFIFDEATSNIDIESENDIINQIYALSKEKTVIMISHRLANVVNANKIYVLSNGQVVQQGTHDILARQEGPYSKMWQQQWNLENFK